jgi:hypothetical protein
MSDRETANRPNSKRTQQKRRLQDFLIRHETLAKRCEICHQSDAFNAETGECARCARLFIPHSFDAHLAERPFEATMTSPPSNAEMNIVPTEEKQTANSKRLLVLCLAVAVVSVAYRILVFGRLEQTSALFIGLPTLLAIIVLYAFPYARSVMGMIMKGLTIAMLLSGILLGEGFVCIIMTAPIVYLVGFLMGTITNYFSKPEKTKFKRNINGFIALPFIIFSLEGMTETLSFPRHEIVTVRRIVTADANSIGRALAQTPRFRSSLPFYLRLGFPRPAATSGSGLRIGDRRVIRFAGGEGHPGDLTLEVTAASERSVTFRVVSDTSKIAHWLDWTESEVSWTAIDSHRCAVAWTLRYTRRLDPAWYFGPMERYAVSLAGEHLIENLTNAE